jgi:hypothetical protein
MLPALLDRRRQRTNATEERNDPPDVRVTHEVLPRAHSRVTDSVLNDEEHLLRREGRRLFRELRHAREEARRAPAARAADVAVTAGTVHPVEPQTGAQVFLGHGRRGGPEHALRAAGGGSVQRRAAEARLPRGRRCGRRQGKQAGACRADDRQGCEDDADHDPEKKSPHRCPPVANRAASEPSTSPACTRARTSAFPVRSRSTFVPRARKDLRFPNRVRP